MRSGQPGQLSTQAIILITLLVMIAPAQPAHAENSGSFPVPQYSESEEVLVNKLLDVNKRARALVAQKKIAEAEQLLVDELRSGERALGIDNEFIGITRSELATIYKETGRREKAEELFLSVANAPRKDGTVLDASSFCELATMYLGQKKYKEADALLRRAIKHNEALVGPDDKSIAFLNSHLARNLMCEGKQSEAIATRSLAIGAFRKIFGDMDYFTVSEELDQARNYALAKEYAQARDLLKPILPELIKTKSEDKVASEMQEVIAAAYAAEGDFEHAEPAYKAALEQTELAYSADDPHTARVLLGMAKLYESGSKTAEAKGYAERALTIAGKLPGETGGNILEDGIAVLVRIHLTNGEMLQALKVYERWMPQLESKLPRTNIKVTSTLKRQAELARTVGDTQKAEAIEARIEAAPSQKSP